MKIAAISLVIASASAMLVGCNEDKSAVSETVQTVDWYKAHKPERDIVLVKCRSNPGELVASPNCINATRADSTITWSAKGAGVKALSPLTADQIQK